VNHRDHVDLIRNGVEGSGTTWADLGSGEGAFTLALGDVLGPAGTIYSIDRDPAALAVQVRRMRAAFPEVRLVQRVADFTAVFDLPRVDGIVMANSLHFVEAKLPLLRRLVKTLRPGGRLVLVEYDTDEGNGWVPYPLSLATWLRVAAQAGFVETRALAEVPSSFLGSIYSAVSVAPHGLTSRRRPKPRLAT
jgi:ubiquinone/menaquinone biosynthesis C-methylase UbiE